jgi:ABC-2 type transport system permease protein
VSTASASRGAPAAGGTTVSPTSRYVNLTRELAVTNFKLKYTGSVLGYLWSLMKPLAYFGILYVIFVDIFHQKGSNFGLQLLVAIVIFTFFAECTSTSLGSVAGNAHLVRKAYFPLSALVVSQSVTALFTMAINLVLVVVIGVTFAHVHLGLETLAVPLLLVELYLLSLGVGMLLAAAFVFYRDLGHVWEVVTQLMLYAAGVVFPAISVPLRLRGLFYLDPLAQIIEDLRHAIVTPDAAWSASLVGFPQYVLPLVLSVLVFVAGLVLFRRLTPLFAESL